jgi:GNAT superfamily N-acetyltransferase
MAGRGTKKADAVRLVLRRKARKQDCDRLERGLIAYNDKQAPHPMRFQHFTITVHSESGRLMGGLDGRMYWGWLYVDKLWLDGRLRRGGIGSRLLAAGEAHARAYGCHGVWLDTMSFQARPFYEKQGYRVIGQLDDFPPGHKRFWLCKQLAPVKRPQRKSAPTASATRAKPSRARSSASSRPMRRARPGPS